MVTPHLLDFLPFYIEGLLQNKKYDISMVNWLK